MTYPEIHSYMTVIGDAYSGTERWQFGLRFNYGGASEQVLADALAVYVKDWWNGTGYTSGTNSWRAPNTHRLTEIKVARIGTDGLYVPGTDSASNYPGNLTGSGTPGYNQAPQDTVAVTLLTAKPRGYASKGRIYPPQSIEMQLGADGKLPTVKAAILAASFKKLLDNINASSYVGQVAVYSKGKGVPSYDTAHNRITYTYPNVGTKEPVTGVSVGLVMDTQRRRRRQLLESVRQEATLA